VVALDPGPTTTNETPARGLRSGTRTSEAYARVIEKLLANECVILDGATGTELPRLTDAEHAADERLWGAHALLAEPSAVLDVHRRYVDAGCDVISTNTWGLASTLLIDAQHLWGTTVPVHSMDLARRGLDLARHAIDEGEREGECAVAFSLNGDLDTDQGDTIIRLLTRVFKDNPPDVILLETLSLLRPSLFKAVDGLLATGLPVWLSFRRCRHGACSVYGSHWGGPEGDTFGRAAARFEQMGAGALMVNCIPPDHVDGMASYLRDFTDLPVGVYPNLGYYTNDGWRFEPGVSPAEYARLAVRWREEGAQIIGGCCGVGPAHIAAASEAVESITCVRPQGSRLGLALGAIPGDGSRRSTWSDRRRRQLYPLPFPDLVADPGVARPSPGSLMTWRFLFEEGIGAHQRCLDIGCGTGILGIQLALNGAAHVRAIDIAERAVRNTETNAFRNGVSERVTAAQVDVYPWIPEERFEVVVACLDQIPIDPYRHVADDRPIDYWGRTPLDEVLVKLAEALAPDGVAYVMHLSILSERHTVELLADLGLEALVVAYEPCDYSSELERHQAHIAKVEELTDAYRLRVGDRDILVAYLLEIRRSPSKWSAAATVDDDGER